MARQFAITYRRTVRFTRHPMSVISNVVDSLLDNLFYNGYTDAENNHIMFASVEVRRVDLIRAGNFWTGHEFEIEFLAVESE